MIIIIITLVGLLSLVTYIYLQQTKFGKSPSGKRLATIQKSWHYKNGEFENVHYTPQIAEGHTMFEAGYEYFFKRVARRIPFNSIPSIKTDLLNIPLDRDILVWFGHSSYFMQIDGKKFLVDPVFSGNASPIPGTNKSFNGTDRYTVADLPNIDYLIITHDHYDHVDYETLIQLKYKTDKVICGLGVGAHLEHWGYDVNKIIEKDWNEVIELAPGFVVHTAPARHFSGRSFSKNNTLWMSYLLVTPTSKIYIGGDSGYDSHFADIGRKFGPIDLAILENGQYNIKWKYIHALPNEVLQAALDLQAKRLFPVHSSKFAMANHPWDEPLIKITELNKPIGMPLVTPMVGEQVNLKDTSQQFKEWWVGIK